MRGFQGVGFPISVHYAMRETAKTQQISGTFSESDEIAHCMRANPDNLSKAALDEITKGVKYVPLLRPDA
jgi:hypothetical protein